MNRIDSDEIGCKQCLPDEVCRPQIQVETKFMGSEASMSAFNSTNEDYINDSAGNVYDVIVAYDAGGGYDWDVYAIVRKRNTDEFYYITDGGCSCNYFGELDYAPDDFKRIKHYSEAVELVKLDSYDAGIHGEFASICNNAREAFRV